MPAPQRVLNGLGVSPGIAIGAVYCYVRPALEVNRRTLDEIETDQEAQLLEESVRRAERDLTKILTLAREKLTGDDVAMFEPQLLMLRDDTFYRKVLRLIRQEHCNAEAAVLHVMSELRSHIAGSTSEYMRDRAHDVQDLQDRLIMHLKRGKRHSAIRPQTIVVSEALTAADLLLFSKHDVLGCVFGVGGATSHTSLIARALKIPAVVVPWEAARSIAPGDVAVIDGASGSMIMHPTPAVRRRYQRKKDEYQRVNYTAQSHAGLPACTTDGRRVRLRANVSLGEELRMVNVVGAEGIGLLRTEAFLLEQDIPIQDEDAQFAQYRRVVEFVQPEVVTIRICDAEVNASGQGLDAWVRGLYHFLGCPEILVPQLRSVLRASAHGPVRLLVPMVRSVEEVKELRAVLSGVQESLVRQGVDFDEALPVGIMVELPAAVEQAKSLAEEVDFFAIGTNDLTQYTLGVDRASDLHQDLHPAVLGLIRETVRAGRSRGIPVSVCGELGGNLWAVPVLVGLGLTELSVAPGLLPAVRRMIRVLRTSDTATLAEDVLRSEGARAARERIHSWMVRHEEAWNQLEGAHIPVNPLNSIT